jgi:hypothetical protein
MRKWGLKVLGRRDFGAVVVWRSLGIGFGHGICQRLDWKKWSYDNGNETCSEDRKLSLC